MSAPRIRRICLYDLLLPSALYTLSFFLLTYPLLLDWSTKFYCEQGDGLQNEWNLWWVRKAIVELHCSPWFTAWLHAPLGTTLIGHTLNPINGLIGIPLGLLFSPVQVYNLIVIGSFVLSGITTFWLARHVAKLYAPALFAGFAFTFTGFHFAHAHGHMQLISTEFIPLFLLSWLRMLERPGIRRGAAAGAVLGMVALCDLNYVFYCVVAGAVGAGFYFSHLVRLANEHRNPARFLLVRFGVFVAVASACCGPFLILLVIANARDPLLGAHDAVEFSADLFSALVPGGADLLGRFTSGYWNRLTGDANEQSLYVGVSVLAMAACGVIYGAMGGRQKRRIVYFWLTIAVGSYALSLGPVLHFHGIEETAAVMPYAWLEHLLPAVKLSGCPCRITIMLALALSMLLALGVAALWQRHDRLSKTVLAAFAVVMIVDLWPSRLPTTRPQYPAWTTALRDLPLPGGVISNVGEHCWPLFYQSLFDRPMAFGYVSRVPQSVDAEDRLIVALARSGKFAQLSEMGFAYIVLPRPRRLEGLPTVYSDSVVNIQQLPVAPPQTPASRSAFITTQPRVAVAPQGHF